MGGVTIDVSEVRALEVDMRAVDSRLVRHIIPVVEKGAANIKGDLRAEAFKSRHFGGMARSITYDMITSSGSGIEAEIGPTKGKPGSIANIAYFGGSAWSGRKNPGRGWQSGPGGGGTVEDPRGALDREAPRFERALADIAAELVFSR